MYVFANQTVAVRSRGRTVRLVRGAAWHRDDPFVQAHPELFNDAPTVVHGQGPPPVEQATAAPGEKRTTKRRKAEEEGDAAGE